MLSERGLAAALGGVVQRAPLPVEIKSVPERRLPESVEVAAYYLVSEALANVAKYAQASAATVAVSRIGDRATVDVADDGIGGADLNRGSGLRGLADRIGALAESWPWTVAQGLERLSERRSPAIDRRSQCSLETGGPAPLGLDGTDA